MRPLRLALFAVMCLAASAAAARPSIVLQDGNWGDANVRDIAAVLDSVAGVLAPHFPRHAGARVVVRYSSFGPRVLANKSADGAHVVVLNVQDRRWDQFAYQFSHELCHVFSNYDQRPVGAQPGAREHQWLEESLCDAVSLYTLNRLAEAWKTAPPHAGWEAYASAFREYADRLLSAEHRRLPRGSLAGWYSTHRAALEADPYLRKKNEQLATSLLDLFESVPQSLEALGYLNIDVPAGQDLAGYLAAWYDCCPPQHRPFVGRLISLLQRSS